MHTAIVIAALGLSGSFFALANAHDCPNVFDDNYYPGGYQGDEEDVYSKLLNCPERTSFCHSLGFTLPETVKTVTVHPTKTVYTSTEDPVYTRTSITHQTTLTKTITDPTSTLTIGESTTTVDLCKHAFTCAAQTFPYYRGHNQGLLTACSCALQRTVTTARSTVTSTRGYIAYITKTISATTTTVHTAPTETKSVEVVTAASCTNLPNLKDVCKNRGVQWAAYNILPQDVHHKPHQLNEWDPAIYKSRAPNITGKTDIIGNIMGDYYAPGEFVYGHKLGPFNITVIHQGYVYATENGIYSFHLPFVETIAMIWVGELAYSGWNRSNARKIQHRAQKGPAIHVRLKAEQYYPFRVVWGVGGAIPNTYGGICDHFKALCSGFYFFIRRPDSRLIDGETNYYKHYELHGYYPGYYPLNTYYYDSSDMVQYSCDDTSAPKFPSYGTDKT